MLEVPGLGVAVAMSGAYPVASWRKIPSLASYTGMGIVTRGWVTGRALERRGVGV